MAFLIRTPDNTVFINGNSVGRTKTTGHDLRSTSIGRNLDHRAVLRVRSQLRVPSALHVVEASIRAFLQAGDRLVEVRRVHGVNVERFVAIGFPVAIEVDQPSDLIATRHQDFFAASFHAQGLT